MKELLSLLITVVYAIPFMFIQSLWEGQTGLIVPTWLNLITSVLVWVTAYMIVRKIYN